MVLQAYMNASVLTCLRKIEDRFWRSVGRWVAEVRHFLRQTGSTIREAIHENDISDLQSSNYQMETGM